MLLSAGAAGFGRTNRQCQHWPSWWKTFKLCDGDNLLQLCPYPWWHWERKMCNLPGKITPLHNIRFNVTLAIPVIYYLELLSTISSQCLSNTGCWLQEDYKFKDSIGKLKCGHDYHADCIKKWLQVKNACAVCKASAADDSRGTEWSGLLIPPHSPYLRGNCIYWLIWFCCVNNGPETDYLWAEFELRHLNLILKLVANRWQRVHCSLIHIPVWFRR